MTKWIGKMKYGSSWSHTFVLDCGHSQNVVLETGADEPSWPGLPCMDCWSSGGPLEKLNGLGHSLFALHCDDCLFTLKGVLASSRAELLSPDWGLLDQAGQPTMLLNRLRSFHEIHGEHRIRIIEFPGSFGALKPITH